MSHIKKLIRGENGQALPLIALMVVVIFGFAALAIDTGMMAFSRSNLQKAADASALAAAMELPPLKKNSTYDGDPILYQEAAIAKGKQYAYANGVPTDKTTISPEISKGIVTANVSETVNHFFAPLLGINNSTIHATAVAARYAVWDGSVLPLINLNEDYVKSINTGITIDLREVFDSSTSDRDWFYMEYYSGLPGYTSIEDFRVNPADGIMVRNGGKQVYVDTYLNPLLQYPPPYYVYSISQTVLNTIGMVKNPDTGILEPVDYGIGVTDSAGAKQTRFLLKKDDGKLTTFGIADIIAPYAKLENIGTTEEPKWGYRPCGKDDPDKVEQLKLLKIDNVDTGGPGANFTIKTVVVKEYSIDYDFSKDKEEAAIGFTKARLIK